ncbi:opioid-binding protein/cell adhesion molecule-like [Mytilus trossulus]|uniref:opioid-binding protein/cell adhesion molecule-like n=1 Tax=Mytilus trossulus TaxID=6551 RepID=UPI003004DA56
MEGYIIFLLLVTVSAIDIPASVNEPSVDEVYVTEGDTATLVCSVTWPGRLIVIWTRIPDESPLTFGTSVWASDARISIQHSRKNDWNLLIRNVKLYDAGKYACHVNGKGISARGAVLLKVNVLAIQIPTPAFKPSAEEVDVTEGGTATLVCSVEWTGRLLVTWGRNFGVQTLTVEGSVLTPDSRISIQHATGTNDWNLVIKDVKPDDAGKYACEVYGYWIRKIVLLKVIAVNNDGVDANSTLVSIDAGPN